MALRRPERIRGANRERGAMVEGIDADFREKTVRANVEHVNLYIYFLTRRALVIFLQVFGSLVSINVKRSSLAKRLEDYVVF